MGSTAITNRNADKVVTVTTVGVKEALDVNLLGGDIEIRAVELKDGSNDNRASISSSGELKVNGSVEVTSIPDVTVTNMIPSVETGLAKDLTLTDGTQKTKITNGSNIASVDSNNALRVFDSVANSLVPSSYDYINLSYTGSDLTQVVFKTGGSSGTIVSTLTLAYSSGNLVSVTKS